MISNGCVCEYSSRMNPCTIQCRLAQGIPQLQCVSCLCLYHKECVMERRGPSHNTIGQNYVCDVSHNLIINNNNNLLSSVPSLGALLYLPLGHIINTQIIPVPLIPCPCACIHLRAVVLRPRRQPNPTPVTPTQRPLQ